MAPTEIPGPSGGPAAGAILALLQQVAARRQAGEQLSDEAVCAAHPELMPGLGEHLRYLGMAGQAHGASGALSADRPGQPPGLLVDSVPGYSILREIHRGGQGVVYQALQKSTKREVAIKVMREGPFASRQDKARFEREVQVLAALKHPNIVAIHESGEAAGSFYFVMDFVSGQPLDAFMAADRRSVRDTLALFQKVCEAVNAAHLRGVIHRDLKPGNIRIDSESQPQILDFGLAKVALGDIGQESAPMTMTGQFVGSLPWASPEQAEGNPSKIDVRTDVYSLGVILYQMLTGKFPYDVVGSMRDLLDRIMTAPPARPSTVMPPPRGGRIDDEVETIVLKCLAKERERRYQSAGELARDIGHYLAGEPIEAKRDSTLYVLRKHLRHYRVPLAVAAGFVVLLASSLIVISALWAGQRQLTMQARAASTRAELERDRAEQEKVRADQRAEQVRRTLYETQIALADSSYRDGAIGRMTELLEQAPADLRGWEWNYLKSISDPSRLTLVGHQSRVISAVFSPDGRQIISGSQDSTLKLWDARSGSELRTLKGHAGWVSWVACRPEGRCVVSAGEDGTVRLWEVETGAELRTLGGHKGTVWCVAFSPDGRQIASGGVDQTVRLWSADTGALLTTLRGHGDVVRAVAFTPDGQRIVSSGDDATVRIWSVPAALELGEVPSPESAPAGSAPNPEFLRIHTTSAPFGLAVSPNGRLIAAAVFADGIISLLDADTGSELRILRGHELVVGSVAFSPDGRWVVSGSEDRTVRLWDVERGAEVRCFRGNRESVRSVAFSPDGRWIVSAGQDGTARIWDVNAGPNPAALGEHQDAASSFAFTPDGTRVVSGSLDGTVKLWDVDRQQELLEIEGDLDTYRRVCVAFSRDGRRMVSGGSGKTVKLYDAETGSRIRMLRGHESPVISVAFSPDGRRIASGSMDGMIKIWDAETGVEVWMLSGHTNEVHSIAFSSNGRWIASGAVDATIRLWDANTGSELRTIRANGAVLCIAFSPDNARLVSGEGAGIVGVWDPETGSRVWAVRRIAYLLVKCVAFSPDGRRILSGGQDNLLTIYDAQTGRERLTLRGHQDKLIAAAFSPDGRRIISGSEDGKILLWDSVPYAERCRQRENLLALVPQATAIVDQVLEQVPDEAAAIERISADTAIPDAVRRLALNNLLRRMAAIQADFLAVDKGSPESVGRLVDRVLSSRPPATLRNFALIDCGVYHLLGGDPVAGLATIQRAIDHGEDDHSAYVSLGWALTWSHRAEEARIAFNQGLAITGDWSSGGSAAAVPDQWAAAYFVDLVSAEEFADRWRNDAKHKTEYACYPWFFIGQRMEIEGKPEAAIAAYRKSVELGKLPDSDWIRNWSAYRLHILTGEPLGPTTLDATSRPTTQTSTSPGARIEGEAPQTIPLAACVCNQ